MKHLLLSGLMIALYGCVSHPVSIQGLATELAASCLGSASLPHNFENKFEAIDNRQLLNEALGGTDEGKLCQGQVYRSKEASQVTVFRAWNSANPNSEFGNWWAFEKPSGEIAKYRSDYEIWYQWSSMDKLIRCTLVINNMKYARVGVLPNVIKASAKANISFFVQAIKMVVIFTKT